MSVVVIQKHYQAGTCETHAKGCKDVIAKLNKGYDIEGEYPNAETAANEFFSDFIPDEMTEEEAFDQINAYPCTK